MSFPKIVLLLVAGLAMLTAAAKDVDVKEYGAIGDSRFLNTKQLQQAIDACHNSGGGRVYFPEGNYLTGTIVIKDHVILHLKKGARILGSTDIEDYRNLDPFTEGLGIDVGWALVVAVDAKNIGVEGEGPSTDRVPRSRAGTS